MLLNSGAELPLDIAQALASKGELSRNLGTFREMRLPDAKAYTPFGKVFIATNKPISSMFNVFDTHMQTSLVKSQHIIILEIKVYLLRKELIKF